MHVCWDGERGHDGGREARVGLETGHSVLELLHLRGGRKGESHTRVDAHATVVVAEVRLIAAGTAIVQATVDAVLVTILGMEVLGLAAREGEAG